MGTRVSALLVTAIAVSACWAGGMDSGKGSTLVSASVGVELPKWRPLQYIRESCQWKLDA